MNTCPADCRERRPLFRLTQTNLAKASTIVSRNAVTLEKGFSNGLTHISLFPIRSDFLLDTALISHSCCCSTSQKERSSQALDEPEPLSRRTRGYGAEANDIGRKDLSHARY